MAADSLVTGSLATVEVLAGADHGHPGMFMLIVSPPGMVAGRLCGPYLGEHLRVYLGMLGGDLAEETAGKRGRL